MCRNLAIGMEKPDVPFLVEPRYMKAHTLVTGQSGCGKTSLVARVIEELLLSEAGSIFLLDYNLDYKAFNGAANPWPYVNKDKKPCREDEAPEFQKQWRTLQNRIKEYPCILRHHED